MKWLGSSFGFVSRTNEKEEAFIVLKKLRRIKGFWNLPVNQSNLPVFQIRECLT
jgi:hypothetical protein